MTWWPSQATSSPAPAWRGSSTCAWAASAASWTRRPGRWTPAAAVGAPSGAPQTPGRGSLKQVQCRLPDDELLVPGHYNVTIRVGSLDREDGDCPNALCFPYTQEQAEDVATGCKRLSSSPQPILQQSPDGKASNKRNTTADHDKIHRTILKHTFPSTSPALKQFNTIFLPVLVFLVPLLFLSILPYIYALLLVHAVSLCIFLI